ncbi:hypothetical protein PanWU01x14_125810 [Parasponia andersonii]|uniref:SGNH hydrolase-type esterase domain containing protein n=1 Tax=Parasponia andersonii TaxID=3476 RepID=A0A2P5CTA2_PARAD|nr:hypothetical protein PanWU01x14_125810 [Parasponia andersonii]
MGPKRSQMAAAIGVVLMASLLYLSRACHFPAIYNFRDSNSDTGASQRLLADFLLLMARLSLLNLPVAKGSHITGNLPKPGSFSKALYTLDGGQNDLHYGLMKLTRKHLKESTSNIINQFSLSIEVDFVLL